MPIELQRARRALNSAVDSFLATLQDPHMEKAAKDKRLSARRALLRGDQARVRLQQGALPGPGQERQSRVRHRGAGQCVLASTLAGGSSPAQ